MTTQQQGRVEMRCAGCTQWVETEIMRGRYCPPCDDELRAMVDEVDVDEHDVEWKEPS